MEVRLSDGGAETVDLVVGADGLHSHTRGLVLPDAPRPRATGQLIWRAPAPRRFGARGFDRCRLVVETSVQLGEWEQRPPADPSLPGRLMGQALAELARPV